MTLEELSKLKTFLDTCRPVNVTIFDANEQGPFLVINHDNGCWVIKLEVK